jgi:pSer/pThr/pTyr-binding forkhead associated (FHA) protein
MGYVIGREPDGDPLVGTNDARPLALTDPDRTISRVHAEVRLNGWDVTVIDRRSQNGTYILPQGAQEWIRLAPDQPTAIGSGTRVLVGRRVLIYDSHGV